MQKINNDIEKIYDEELKKAIINGDGSEENPYEVDYSLAPNFQRFVENSYSEATVEKNSGLTKHIFTKYQGAFSTGGMWVYKTGGLKVSSDGNLRVVRAIYLSVSQTNELYSAKQDNTAWVDILGTISSVGGLAGPAVIAAVVSALTRKGIKKIREYTDESVAFIVSRMIGAFEKFVAAVTLIKSVTSGAIDGKLKSAASEKLTFINIYYLTSYHGEWYAHTTSETGWTNDKVYVPSSTYGTGDFITK